MPAEGRHWGTECPAEGRHGLHWGTECPAEGRHAGTRSALSASWIKEYRAVQHAGDPYKLVPVHRLC